MSGASDFENRKALVTGGSKQLQPGLSAAKSGVGIEAWSGTVGIFSQDQGNFGQRSR
jgi:hypothetical protein